MLEISFFLIFSTTVIIGYLIIPAFSTRALVLDEERHHKLENTMEKVMSRQEASKKRRLFIFFPLILPAVAYVLVPPQDRVIWVIVAFVAGIIIPSIYVKILIRRTRQKFDDQMIDALSIMSSSFRGGLSLVQSFEAVIEEMPNPINREFAFVLGENKMGVSLEESLNHLYNRMPSTALQQMITAILLSRETGGNLPEVFTRIINNIRETRKIEQNMYTLTLQGKIQGVVMSLLPIAFCFVLYSSNRHVFNHMLESEMGQKMLIYAVVSEIIGVIMIIRISTIKDY